MSTKIDLGQVFLLLDGTWQQDKPYSRLTVVERNGSSYASLADNIGKDPEQYTMVWMPIAKKGDKGDAFTYDDFTPEQIELLQRPATEAAEKANQAVAQIEDTDTEIKTAESERQQAEIKRAQAEAGRVAEEQKRVVDFTKIVESSVAVITDADDAAERANNAALTAETATNAANDAADEVKQTENSVKQAESLRASAELQRETHETERQQAEADRQLAEQGRATAEEDRRTAESGREAAEQERESAEQSRVTEFAQLKQESETATNNANDAAEKANDSVANMLVKTEQALTHEEKDQVQSNIGVKDTIDIVGVEPVQKIAYTIWKDGYYRSYLGFVVQTNDYIISNVIKVTAGSKIRYRAFGGSSVINISEVLNNDEHTFVKEVFKGASTEEYQEFIADRDMYIELCGLKAGIDTNIYIKKYKIGSTPLVPKGGYNRDLYESVGAVYNEETGGYQLNGLTDITESEMAIIYSESISLQNLIFDRDAQYASSRFRTNIVNKSIYTPARGEFKWTETFRECKNLEVLKFYLTESHPIKISSISTCFYGCNNLRIIDAVLDLGKCNYSSLEFNKCDKLEKVKFKNIKASISFSDSPQLSKESILYMIQNSAATSAITITLHPDAYAMAMADTEIQAALAEKKFVSLASA